LSLQHNPQYPNVYGTNNYREELSVQLAEINPFYSHRINVNFGASKPPLLIFMILHHLRYNLNKCTCAANLSASLSCNSRLAMCKPCYVVDEIKKYCEQLPFPGFGAHAM
jgi:hypothetical protein